MRTLTERVEWELDEVIAEIFEAMTDTRCVPSWNEGLRCLDLIAKIEFREQMRGWCRLSMGVEDAEEYVRVLLGMTPECCTDLRVDSVSELCNMIAGGWKSLQAPPTSGASMSAPHANAADGRETDAAYLRWVRRYAFGQRGFDVEIALHREDAAVLMRADDVSSIS